MTNPISRLHVCLLTSGRIFEAAFGGEEKFTLALANWLVEHDYEVTVMASRFANVTAKRWSKTLADEQAKRKFSKQHFRVLRPPYFVYLLSRIILSMLWIIKIVSLNMQTPISVIHAQDTGYSGLAAVLAGKLLKIPVIISSHGIRHNTLSFILHGKLRNILLKIEFKTDVYTTRNANQVIAVNPSIKEYYEKIIGKNIDFIPVPINMKNFEYSDISRDQIRTEIGVDETITLIGYVGRFSPEKNLTMLVRSFVDAAQYVPTIQLILVGMGEVETQLRNYLKTTSVENRVVFLGVRYDIAKVLAGLDIFVLPSFAEGLSMSLMEAMASKRAIICSNILANKILINQNVEGLVVDPNDEGKLMNAILELAGDKSMRERLAEAARNSVRQYDEEIVFPKIVGCYRQLLGNDQ